MIEGGQLSPVAELRLIAGPATPARPAPVAITSAPTPLAPELESWRRWWLLPLAGGVAVLAVGALLMLAAYVTVGVGFWFAVAALPAVLGVLIMALAAAGRSVLWLHVRVDSSAASDDWPRRIAISLPLPIHPIAWLLRACGPFVPRLQELALDELILALAEAPSAGAPFYVEVDEGDGGERVLVYIG